MKVAGEVLATEAERGPKPGGGCHPPNTGEQLEPGQSSTSAVPGGGCHPPDAGEQLEPGHCTDVDAHIGEHEEHGGRRRGIRQAGIDVAQDAGVHAPDVNPQHLPTAR